MTNKYGIYSTDGKKLKNSDKIIKEHFWSPITESVLDRIVNDFFGILKHNIYIGNTKYWIVRESEKQHFKYAPEWYRKEKNV